jgi:hypothetical protein
LRTPLEILEEIRKTLKENQFIFELEQLNGEINASSTGGELCVRSGSLLLTLQKQNQKVKKTIGHLIDEFIVYCNSVNLFPVEKK